MKVLLDHQFYNNAKIDVLGVNLSEEGAVESYKVRVLLEDENDNQLKIIEELTILVGSNIKDEALSQLSLTELIVEEGYGV